MKLVVQISTVVVIVSGFGFGLPRNASAFDPLNPAHCYDAIVVVHDCLAQAAEPLAIDESLRTCLVKTSEVLNSFGGGSDTLTACHVRDFVNYAYDNWMIAPQYLLLVGDLSIRVPDSPPLYHGYIPSYACTSDNFPEFTPYFVDDGRIATFPDHGPRPAMHVGRIPARCPSELNHYVDKVLQYENSGWQDWWDNVLFLVGDREVYGIDNSVMRIYADYLLSEELGSWGDLSVLWSADYDSSSYAAGDATQDTRDAWNHGIGLAAAFGNTVENCMLALMASPFCCPGPTFTDSLGATLKFPILLSGSCFVNFFYWYRPSWPAYRGCAADDLLLSRSDRGAVASYASCHVTPAFENYLMNKIFLDLFAKQGVRDLGRLCTATEVEYQKQGIGAEFVPWQFCLLGDPTIQIKVPQCENCHEEDYRNKWISGIEMG